LDHELIEWNSNRLAFLNQTEVISYQHKLLTLMINGEKL
jgi:hypothetical protein